MILYGINVELDEARDLDLLMREIYLDFYSKSL